MKKSNENFLEKLKISDGSFKIKKCETQFITKHNIQASFLGKKQDMCLEKTADLQNKLFAENRQSMLIIFQGMDSAGKDSVIKHIMKGLNPQGVLVHSFKHPSNQDLDHDYLWRHVIKLPEHGQIVIFNRSYFENVLISQVHPELVLAEGLKEYDQLSKINNNFWNKRYSQIKNFEKRMTETGTQILKFFLHISKEEQSKRFLSRINNPDKHWKFSSSDIEERKYWTIYQRIYEKVINHTSTKKNPWHIIPADDKIIARSIISEIILEKLKEMNPTYPQKTEEEQIYMNKAKVDLENECSSKKCD